MFKKPQLHIIPVVIFLQIMSIALGCELLETTCTKTVRFQTALFSTCVTNSYLIWNNLNSYFCVEESSCFIYCEHEAFDTSTKIVSSLCACSDINASYQPPSLPEVCKTVPSMSSMISYLDLCLNNSIYRECFDQYPNFAKDLLQAHLQYFNGTTFVTSKIVPCILRRAFVTLTRFYANLANMTCSNVREFLDSQILACVNNSQYYESNELQDHLITFWTLRNHMNSSLAINFQEMLFNTIMFVKSYSPSKYRLTISCDFVLNSTEEAKYIANELMETLGEELQLKNRGLLWFSMLNSWANTGITVDVITGALELDYTYEGNFTGDRANFESDLSMLISNGGNISYQSHLYMLDRAVSCEDYNCVQIKSITTQAPPGTTITTKPSNDAAKCWL